MQIAQRSTLIIGICIMLSFVTAVLFSKRESNILRSWENVQTERFLKRLCRTGQCSQEDYVLLLQALGCSGNKGVIRIEEYQLEQGLTKKKYYSVVPWEEIRNYLYEEKLYEFAENSIVMIEVLQTGRNVNTKNKHFGFVIGENGNDT